MQATVDRSIDDPGVGSEPTDPPTAWHALAADEVVATLGTDLDVGLSAPEAHGRLQRFGPNALGGGEPRRRVEILLSQFTSPLIAILLVALVVTLSIDKRTDAAVIAVTLLINAVIGFTQERKADQAVNALTELAAPRSTVVRDGREQDLESSLLVPGDVVLLTSGTRVPADVRLARTTSLEVDESLLTGESAPARKGPEPVAEGALPADRSGIAHLGTVVARGRGHGVVVATAGDTELGTIAESIREEERPRTPLQQRMHRFANIVAAVVVASTAVTFLLGLALGEPVDQMFLTAVALAVAVVPEGLPIAYTVAMAIGVRRMARRNAIIRALPAVETLGSTQTIGSDKTGTLTANRMTVRRAWTGEGWVTFDQTETADRHAAGAAGSRPRPADRGAQQRGRGDRRRC